MLCVHGFPESWFSWKHQMEMFRGEYEVVALQVRKITFTFLNFISQAQQEPKWHLGATPVPADSGLIVKTYCTLHDIPFPSKFTRKLC